MSIIITLSAQKLIMSAILAERPIEETRARDARGPAPAMEHWENAMVVSMAEKLLNVGEAAAYLGVSPNSLRRWSDAGTLRAVRLPGGARRFEREELDRWKREHGFRVDEGPA